MQGSVSKIDRHKRIAVLELDFFGQLTSVTVGLEIVKKLGSHVE
jgi:transcriptional antiterminator NusG